LLRALQWAAATDQINNQHDDCNDQQEMNQSATKVPDKSKQPEHE